MRDTATTTACPNMTTSEKTLSNCPNQVENNMHRDTPKQFRSLIMSTAVLGRCAIWQGTSGSAGALSIYLSMYLFIYVSIYLSIYLSNLPGRREHAACRSKMPAQTWQGDEWRKPWISNMPSRRQKRPPEGQKRPPEGQKCQQKHDRET